MGTSNVLNISEPGYMTFDGIATFKGRTFQAGTGITISNATGISGDTTISASGATVFSLTGNSGGAVVPSGNNINVVTANSTVKFVGASPTLTQDFGLSNLIMGSSATSITTAAFNAGIGNTALNALTSGSGNTAVGFAAANKITTGSSNTAIGIDALFSATITISNVAVGANSMNSYTGLGGNTAIGQQALFSLISGIDNISIGRASASAYVGGENYNIIIGNAGVAAETNTIRMGINGGGADQQNRCFVAGITAITVAGSAPVGIDTNSQLSSLGFGTSGQVLTSTGAASSPTWQTKTITGDSGGALSQTSSNWNIVGLSGSKTSGATSTLTIKSPPYADQGGSTSVTLNSGSFATAGITLTTPVTAGLADGDLLEFVVTAAVTLVIQLAATQVAHLGNVATTVAGTITSSAIGDSISFRYQASTNDWWATSSIGNWTLA